MINNNENNISNIITEPKKIVIIGGLPPGFAGHIPHGFTSNIPHNSDNSNKYKQTDDKNTINSDNKLYKK